VPPVLLVLMKMKRWRCETIMANLARTSIPNDLARLNNHARPRDVMC
jgi:hypothetical protein